MRPYHTTLHYRIARLPAATGQTPRFCIIDANSGRVINDANGNGFRTEASAQAALQNLLTRKRNPTKKPGQQENRTAIKRHQTTGYNPGILDIWQKKHRREMAEIKDLFQYAARTGFVVKEKDIEELLGQYGTELPISASDFIAFWTQNGEMRSEAKANRHC